MRLTAITATILLLFVLACDADEDVDSEAPTIEPTASGFPTPLCALDPETFLPLPGQPDFCALASYPRDPVPTPFIYLGPIHRDPAALLTGPAVHRIGTSDELGRSDCPAAWGAVISDTSGMSICFPADIGRVTAGGPDRPVFDEDWFEITLSGKELPAVVVINVIRSAGLSGPHSLECLEPAQEVVAAYQALHCEWGTEGVTITPGIDIAKPWYASAYYIERNGFQWIFEGVIWGSTGAPDKDITSLVAVIADVAATLRLP